MRISELDFQELVTGREKEAAEIISWGHEIAEKLKKVQNENELEELKPEITAYQKFVNAEFGIYDPKTQTKDERECHFLFDLTVFVDRLEWYFRDRQTIQTFPEYGPTENIDSIRQEIEKWLKNDLDNKSWFDVWRYEKEQADIRAFEEIMKTGEPLNEFQVKAMLVVNNGEEIIERMEQASLIREMEVLEKRIKGYADFVDENFGVVKCDLFPDEKSCSLMMELYVAFDWAKKRLYPENRENTAPQHLFEGFAKDFREYLNSFGWAYDAER